METTTTRKALPLIHVSPETAYVVDDYPYGFRLRTKIRYWIETTKNGQRFVSQTLNPKTNRWNNPKKSTYHDIATLNLNEDNHVRCDTFSLEWGDLPKMYEFQARNPDTLLDPYCLKIFNRMVIIAEARKVITVTVGPVTPGSPRQTDEEKRRITRAAMRHGERVTGQKFE